MTRKALFAAAVTLASVVACSGEPASSTLPSGTPSSFVSIPTPDSPTPQGQATASAQPPAPAGVAVTNQELAPALVFPARSLCAASLQRYQDGSAFPLFCRDGAINVDAWTYLAPIDSNLLAAGPAATIDDVEAAIRSDFDVNHSTNVIEYGGYQLAAAYYGWSLAFDYWSFVAG